MRSLLLALMLVFASSTAAIACPCTGDDQPCVCDAGCKCEMKTDRAFGVTYTEEQIVNLPQDQNKFYVTILGTPGETKFETVKGWFEKTPELKSIKAQTHFNTITTSSPDFAARYKATTPVLPCIRLQSADGKVFYQVSGQNIPMSGEALTKSINTQCLRRWRQQCNPQPQPQPQPEPQPDPNPTPDVEPQPEPVDPGFPYGLFAAVVAVSGAIGGGIALVKKYKEERKAAGK